MPATRLMGETHARMVAISRATADCGPSVALVWLSTGQTLF